MKKTLLTLASLATLTVHAQTVVTPPRSITAQQETTGNDSTFQGDVVVPNTQTSTFQMSITAPAAPTPPTPTCAASSSSKTLTQTITPTVSQTASCPAGYLTTSYTSTFTQYATQIDNQDATQTTTTTCPSGIYGSPNTSTTTSTWTNTSSSTGAWSPTAASACTVYALQNYIPGLNGQGFYDNGTAAYVGGFDHAYGEVLVTVSNGSYSITYPGGASTFNPKTYQAPVPVTGTWLPAGRVASDFTVTLSISNTQVTEQPIRVVYPASGSYQPTLVTFTNSPPNPTRNGFSGIGVSTPTVSANGAGTVGVDVGGGELYRTTTGPNPTTGGATGVYTTATVTITITDNRGGESSSTSFQIGAGL